MWDQFGCVHVTDFGRSRGGNERVKYRRLNQALKLRLPLQHKLSKCNTILGVIKLAFSWLYHEFAKSCS